MEGKSDWASIPMDILECVLRKIKFESIDEYIAFGSVCRSWHHILEQQQQWQDLAQPPQLPLLMVVPSPDYRQTNKRRRLYNIFNGKTCTLPLNLPYNQRCCGSSHGWLAVNTRSYYKNVKLINPTAQLGSPGRKISLPQITRNGEPLDIFKVVLSHDPDLVPPQECAVAATYGKSRHLAIMRLSEEKWTLVDPRYENIHDVVFGRGGRLYAVEIHGSLISVNLASPERVYDCAISNTFYNFKPCKTYIVLSAVRGDILLVRRFEDISGNTRFRVYRLIQGGKDGGWRWVDMKSLNNEVLFVGENQSMSFSCDDIGRSSSSSSCVPNSIYYTNDLRRYKQYGSNDVGVYHLEDGSFEPTYGPSSLNNYNNFPLPVFIVPKLCNLNLLSSAAAAAQRNQKRKKEDQDLVQVAPTPCSNKQKLK